MYQPVVPLSGYAGWSFLQRTRETQEKAFDNSSEMVRDTEYFREKIGSITTADQLVSDRRLLKVALGAFGLDDDINSKAFIRKVLEEGTLTTDAFANKLADKRYHAMAKAFGFGDYSTPSTVLSDFPDEIIDSYKERQFEIAIGDQDENLRLAMGFGRDLESAIKSQSTDNGRWYAVMGNTPLRKVFETALGLPSSFGNLDLDKQLTGFRDAAARRFGVSEVADFADPEVQDKLIRSFLVRAEINASSSGSQTGQIALTLLQSSTISYPKLF